MYSGEGNLHERRQIMNGKETGFIGNSTFSHHLFITVNLSYWRTRHNLFMFFFCYFTPNFSNAKQIPLDGNVKGRIRAVFFDIRGWFSYYISLGGPWTNLQLRCTSFPIKLRNAPEFGLRNKAKLADTTWILNQTRSIIQPQRSISPSTCSVSL